MIRKPFCDCDTIHSEIINEVKKNFPKDKTLKELSDFFFVFGDITRTKILIALDKSEMCVCDLAAFLVMTKSAVSHQLKLLRETKLVKFRKEGRIVFYSLSDSHVKDIVEKGLEHISER